MRFEAVADAVGRVPYTTPELGRLLYDHVVTTRPKHVLEIGTAHGAGTAYIAAALKAVGRGRVTTVDYAHAGYTDPTPEETVGRAGVADFINFVKRTDSSYTWFLKEQVEQRCDDAGNVEPTYDFCFLDGGHNWTIDGFSAVLIEKLLRSGGWLLLDDLDWTYAEYDQSVAAAPTGAKMHALSESERRTPHMRAVWELIVKQHPSFTEFREQGSWGWARKAPGEPRRLTFDVQVPLAVRAERLARRAPLAVRLAVSRFSRRA